jgi:hypothetical protein
MPKEARNEGKEGVLRQGAPKNRRASEREAQRRGETVRNTEGGGAPEGGQIDGRQGDQEGMRR